MTKLYKVREHMRRESKKQREYRERLLAKLAQLRVEIMERDLMTITRQDVEAETA